MRVRRISLRTMLLVMMVAVTLCTMLLFNAVYGNMTGEVFSQLDLRLINQNLARAKDRLDEVLLGAQDLWDYVQDSVCCGRTLPRRASPPRSSPCWTWRGT